jgi:putative hemolysin
MMGNLLTIVIIILILCLEGLFSGGEIALVAADIHKIRNKAKTGSRSALMTMKLMEKPEWFLSTTLTGTNLCVVTNTAIVTSLFISVLGAGRGEIVSVCVMIPLLLIMGEIVPKSIFQQHAEAIALRLSWFIWVASLVFYPIVFVISRISRGALYAFSEEQRTYYLPYITKAGLEFVLQRKADNGDIRTSEMKMIQRIFDFSESTAEQIMVPLSNITAFSTETTLREAALIISERGYSRIPVYRDRVYNIIGIVRSFDLLEVLYGDTPKSISVSENDSVETCVRKEVLYVPETKPTDELLFELQRRGEHMAVVVDEYGGAVGVVTIEDILEEIVGEIDDEYSDNGRKLYRKVGPGKYLLDAQIKIDYVREIIPFEIPEGDYETLGGYLLHKMERIPQRNESYRQGDILFIIEDADMKSIKEVLVVLPENVDKLK